MHHLNWIIATQNTILSQIPSNMEHKFPFKQARPKAQWLIQKFHEKIAPNPGK